MLAEIFTFQKSKLGMLLNTVNYSPTFNAIGDENNQSIMIRMEVKSLATVTKPILLDETGKSIVEALQSIKQLMDDGSIVIPGPEGPVGPAAGFGKITAQVDNTSDDLSVDVNTSGSNDALNIDFMFHGLKSNSNPVQYMFSVNDEGHLILNYTGDEAPNFSIKEDGHLYLNI